MKNLFLIRALALCLGLVGAVGATARAQEAYKVTNIRQMMSNDLIKVGHDWRKDLPRRLQVTLQVAADTPAASVFVHAYFYDKDNALVGTLKGPNTIWTSTPKGIQEVLLPPTLTRFKNTDVFFALPEDLQAKKWTTVLVAFGDATKAAAMAVPISELSKLDFPEKAKLIPAH